MCCGITLIELRLFLVSLSKLSELALLALIIDAELSSNQCGNSHECIGDLGSKHLRFENLSIRLGFELLDLFELPVVLKK